MTDKTEKNINTVFIDGLHAQGLMTQAEKDYQYEKTVWLEKNISQVFYNNAFTVGTRREDNKFELLVSRDNLSRLFLFTTSLTNMDSKGFDGDLVVNAFPMKNKDSFRWPAVTATPFTFKRGNSNISPYDLNRISNVFNSLTFFIASELSKVRAGTEPCEWKIPPKGKGPTPLWTE